MLFWYNIHSLEFILTLTFRNSKIEDDISIYLPDFSVYLGRLLKGKPENLNDAITHKKGTNSFGSLFWTNSSGSLF